MPVVHWQLYNRPNGSIAAANSSVAKVFKKQHKQTEAKKPHGEYLAYTAKERAEIGKRVALYGINLTIKYYKINPQRPLPSSSAFDMKVKYH